MHFLIVLNLPQGGPIPKLQHYQLDKFIRSQKQDAGDDWFSGFWFQTPIPRDCTKSAETSFVSKNKRLSQTTGGIVLY
ncbi:unnamed protein product [Acanthoscelides obtectus]|uniref:Uncharacterized protein n=1 Tax=Acanthoscelides obtectus TaxID=200917 RepID=A0A9P0P279_ACAOB|nr:unnamed protein product [Acanthoscelides obtectus]CAK1647131.1 hypothetical protein AOBTE_LOCUS15063 [Acanthoscelides obtectus]